MNTHVFEFDKARKTISVHAETVERAREVLIEYALNFETYYEGEEIGKTVSLEGGITREEFENYYGYAGVMGRELPKKASYYTAIENKIKAFFSDYPENTSYPVGEGIAWIDSWGG